MGSENFLKNKLLESKHVLGTWITIPSVKMLDSICSSGLDFVILDLEHGSITMKDLQEMIIVCEANSVSPVVRVPCINEELILKSLDFGAHCVQVPNVVSNSCLARIIKYSKYPPIGERGFSPFTRSGHYGGSDRSKLTSYLNSFSMLAINIESNIADKDLLEMLGNPYIDIYFIGLYDLSKSLGYAGMTDHPIVQKRFTQMTKLIMEKNKYVGSIATNIEDVILYKKNDLNYIVYLVDSAVIRESYYKAKQAIIG